MKNNKYKLLKYIIGILFIILILIGSIYLFKYINNSQKENFQTLLTSPTDFVTGLVVEQTDLTKFKTFSPNVNNYNNKIISTNTLFNINNVTGKISPSIWNAKYDSRLNSTLNTYLNELSSPKKEILSQTCNNPYIYTLDSTPECTMVHAGLITSGTTVSNVTVAILPSYTGQAYYSTATKYGVQNMAYSNPWRCYTFYSIDGYVIHELMGKYDKNDNVINTTITMKIKGDGSFNTTSADWGIQRVWGDGTYTLDSYVPRAAVHEGILINNETKIVSIKLLGTVNKFIGSTKNNITTLSFTNSYYAFQFVKTDEVITTTAPMTSTTAPMTTTTTAPMTSTTTTAPMTSTTTTALMTTTTTAPMTSTTTAPMTSTTAPMTSTTTTAPMTSTTAPMTSTTAPMTSTTAPMTSTTAPMTSTTAPMTSTTAPMTSTTAPMTSTTAPMTSTTYYTDPNIPEITDPVTTMATSFDMSEQSYSGASMSTIAAQFINPETTRSGTQPISYITDSLLNTKLPSGNKDTIFNIPGI